MHVRIVLLARSVDRGFVPSCQACQYMGLSNGQLKGDLLVNFRLRKVRTLIPELRHQLHEDSTAGVFFRATLPSERCRGSVGDGFESLGTVAVYRTELAVQKLCGMIHRARTLQKPSRYRVAEG